MGVIKYNMVDGFNFDVSAAVHLKDMFHAGLSYSLKNGIAVFTGVKLDNLSFRYILEIPVSADVPTRFTSHLIQLSMNLGQPID
jgi:hypothetical protein